MKLGYGLSGCVFAHGKGAFALSRANPLGNTVRGNTGVHPALPRSRSQAGVFPINVFPIVISADVAQAQLHCFNGWVICSSIEKLCIFSGVLADSPVRGIQRRARGRSSFGQAVFSLFLYSTLFRWRQVNGDFLPQPLTPQGDVIVPRLDRGLHMPAAAFVQFSGLSSPSSTRPYSLR